MPEIPRKYWNRNFLLLCTSTHRTAFWRELHLQKKWNQNFLVVCTSTDCDLNTFKVSALTNCSYYICSIYDQNVISSEGPKMLVIACGRALYVDHVIFAWNGNSTLNVVMDINRRAITHDTIWKILASWVSVVTWDTENQSIEFESYRSPLYH